MSSWFIEGYITNDQTTRRMAIDKFPFVVGRDNHNALIIRSGEVSRKHAEFQSFQGRLLLTDLGSTNGTFVNRERITDSLELHNGDILRFGDREYRVVSAADMDAVSDQPDDDVTCLSMKALDTSYVPEGVARLRELLDNKLVNPVFQPIVLPDASVCGYELLGRGGHGELPIAPVELFNLAETVGLEVELSEVFRDEGMRVAADSGLELDFFLNTHPAELKDPDRLLDSLHELRKNYPKMAITLEIHEQGVTDTDLMKELQRGLKRLSMDIAYDDFGAGQSRLIELVEATPKIVKFDICLIRNIDSASEARIKMLKLLMQMCQEVQVQTLAEGVGRLEEAEVCLELGFDLLQGFHYGRPAPLEAKEKVKRFKFF